MVKKRRQKERKTTSNVLFQLLPFLRRIVSPDISQPSLLPKLSQSFFVGVSILGHDRLEELGSSKSESAKERRVEFSSASRPSPLSFSIHAA